MKTLFPLALLPVLLGPSLASAEDAYHWGDAGGWKVMVDDTLDNGCFIVKAFGDTAVRLGFAPSNSNAYIAIGNGAWASIETGKEYKIRVTMDGEIWDAPATGIGVDGFPMLLTTIDSEFMIDFMRKHRVKVEYQGRTITDFSLSGTFAAGEEMLNCQTTMNNVGADSAPALGQSDPFAGEWRTRNASDPFAR